MTWARVGLAFALLAVGCGDDGASVADAGVDAGPDAAVPLIGNVTIIEGTLSGSPMTIIAAAFGVNRSVISTERDDGPCHISRGRQMMGTGFVGAGTLTIASSTQTDVLVADSQNLYAVTFPGLRYSANQVLTISTSGGGIPINEMLTFPEHLTVSTQPTALSKSGLTVSWDVSPGEVHLQINQYLPSNGPMDTFISCDYPGGAGTATLPASTLADLVVGSNASVSLSTQSTAMIMAGSYPTTLGAIFGPSGPRFTVQP